MPRSAWGACAYLLARHCRRQVAAPALQRAGDVLVALRKGVPLLQHLLPAPIQLVDAVRHLLQLTPQVATACLQARDF